MRPLSRFAFFSAQRSGRLPPLESPADIPTPITQRSIIPVPYTAAVDVKPTDTCPICTETYTDADADAPEKHRAIRIISKDCDHVFGYRCLTKLIITKRPWANKCPICRNIWFDLSDPSRNLSHLEELLRAKDVDLQVKGCVQSPKMEWGGDASWGEVIECIRVRNKEVKSVDERGKVVLALFELSDSAG
ncbi:hypothetical protein CC80DRAFT_554862 [Byssothecium circinans]|uniref:RING-type domain-containing protein n=1 Tax=Byssothecium circinans TaxID=147558 RepID=A0A6A5TE66_9PLEO|nr:hypothetical protein CC80DRAFT_554862 [Byssothecium circinans]